MRIRLEAILGKKTVSCLTEVATGISLGRQSSVETQPFPPGRVEKVLNLGVLLHVSGEERADGNDLKAPLACCLESETDQRRADAFPFVTFRDFRVREQHLPGGQRVFGERQASVAKIDLETVSVGIVADDEVLSG